ncbi:MAG: aldose epimerase family protein [Pseudomonadota bacterium]
MTPGLKETFGKTASGEIVERVCISSVELTAHILTWGAVVQDLRHTAQADPLVLGFEQFEHYPAHSPFFGATAGRCANRIAQGRFTLDGVEHQLDNAGKEHHLHGGAASFGKRNWIVEGHGEDYCILSLISRDGEAGYPGTVSVRATFRVTDGTLAVTYEGSTSAPTLFNLAHHSYFSLKAEQGDIRDHVVELPTTRYTATGDDLIPTGEIADATGTDRDYTDGRPIGERTELVLDDNFCIADQPLHDLALAARVTAPDAPLSLEVWSDQPGIQVYCGHKIDCPVTGLGGVPLKPWAGIALEPQIWPDAIHHEHFPSAVLRPRETRIQRSEFRFLAGS